MKRELAKKEGRLLTKKQKEEKAAAERRRQALISSGVQIEGLQQLSGAPSAGKKVVYGSRKKKGPLNKDKDSAPASPALESRPLSPAPATASPSPSPAPAELPNTVDGVKDEWDASSAEEDNDAAPVPPVKEEWDASSEDDVSAAPPPSERKIAKVPTILPASPTSQPAKGASLGPYILSSSVSLFIKVLQPRPQMGQQTNPKQFKHSIPSPPHRNPLKRCHLKMNPPKTTRRMIQRAALKSPAMA